MSGEWSTAGSAGRRLVRLRWFCRSQPVLWWAASLAAGVGATAVWQQQVSALAAQRHALVKPELVIVATHDLALGTVITAGDLRAETRPSAFVPRDAVRILSPSIGRVVREPIMAGEAVAASRLGAGTGVEALLRPSERAVALPTGDHTPPVELGTLVDLVAAAANGGTAQTDATLLVQGARVVGVRDRTVVVAVPSNVLPEVADALAQRTVLLAVSGTPPRPQ